ncbi:MAG: RNA polymerase sigma factor [Oscillospiraceae bacterium]|jgi:RNA polymerase sigma-70 factor (ECF subfamily)|nr:RNA polymerase sigma factor [Oscillospiraceae bacterium]
MEIAEIFERHAGTVYRVCFAYMKNPADTEDAVQDAFLKLLASGKAFESAEHEKAWLIRIASNLCKDKLKSAARKNVSLEERGDGFAAPEVGVDDTLGAVLALPEKYKTVIYLHYYEGYTGVEISKLLKRPQSTVRNYLHEARELLRERLGDNFEK